MEAKQDDSWSGIFKDIPAGEYHARRLDVVSASGMKQMLRTPAHFAHWVANPDEDNETPAKAFGKALHCATLEPEVFERTYTVVPTDAPRYPTSAQWNAKKSSPESVAAMDYWRQWEADNAGRIRLAMADYDRARFMADSVRRHPVAAGLLVGGDREITFRWMDEETGLRCKSRADLYAAGEFLMDLKSCRDASPEGFARAVHTYGYDVQAAHYVEGVRACGDSIRYMVFCAVESEPPFVCQPYLLDAEAEQRGYTLRRRAMKRQAECLQSGHWPGYSDSLGEIHLPTYAFFGIEEETA